MSNFIGWLRELWKLNLFLPGRKLISLKGLQSGQIQSVSKNNHKTQVGRRGTDRSSRKGRKRRPKERDLTVSFLWSKTMSQVVYRGNQYDTEVHKAEVQAELKRLREQENFDLMYRGIKVNRTLVK